MWTVLRAGAAGLLTLLAVGCASSQAPPKQPAYFRSPSRDYVDAPRSASDGDALGAHRQQPDDWISVAPTIEHPALGWVSRYGRFEFEPEHARGGHGVSAEATTCGPALATPVRSATETKVRAELYRAWLETHQPQVATLASSAVAELATAEPRWLDCDR